MKRIVLIASMLLVTAAEARWDARYAQNDPEINRWIDGLQDSKGNSCCASADGYRPTEVEYDTKSGHYRAELNGHMVDVPDEAVIKQPNRIGRALLWYYVNVDEDGGGAIVIRCFLPASGA